MSFTVSDNDNIVDCSEIINIPKPFKSNIIKCGKPEPTQFETQIVENIIKTMRPQNYVTIRNKLYNIFIYQANIYLCLWLLYKKLGKKDINKMFHFLLAFFHGYNNNYRHIYHTELFIYNCMSIS